MKIDSRQAVSFSWKQAKQIARHITSADGLEPEHRERYATAFLLASASGLRCEQHTGHIGPCKNVAAYRTVVLADREGKEAMRRLKTFIGSRIKNPNALVFPSKNDTPLRENNVLRFALHPALKALDLPQAGMHAFRHGCNRRWELAGMNPAVLRQQMGHSSAVMTARYTGEITLAQVQAAFSSMKNGELENMENEAAA